MYDCGAVVVIRAGLGPLLVPLLGIHRTAVHGNHCGDAVEDLEDGPFVSPWRRREDVDEPRRNHETSSIDDGYSFEALHGHRRDEVSTDIDVPHRIQPSFGINDTAP
jgi:hypothetical protein